MSRFRLFGAIVLALVLASVEIFSRLAFAFWIAPEDPHALLRAAAYTPGGPERAFPGARLRAMDPNAARTARMLLDTDEVIHPYVGFVSPPPASARGFDMQTLGLGVGPFVDERREDTVVMGIVGGSVAANFVYYGGPEHVFRRLQEHPEYRGKELIVLAMAQGGQKQPQSLLALAYYLSLGGKLDVLLLIDGFNEVVLPPVENTVHGVFPFFPRGWAYRVADLNLATETRAQIGQLAYLARRRSAHARFLLGSPLRHVRTILLVWWLSDQWLAGQLSELHLELQSEPVRDRLEYLATGPQWPAPDEASLLRDLVGAWKEGSFQMRALCESYGIAFYHFLQPNQHVPGSKPMSPEERAVAVTPDHPYIRHVEAGYPLLRAAGEGLRGSGVRFHDLTDVFSQASEPLYVDDCCHLGERGNELLAGAIAEAIHQDAKP